MHLQQLGGLSAIAYLRMMAMGEMSQAGRAALQAEAPAAAEASLTRSLLMSCCWCAAALVQRAAGWVCQLPLPAWPPHLLPAPALHGVNFVHHIEQQPDLRL
jgi:hypothetical protein